MDISQDYSFKCISLINRNFGILLLISPKFVTKVPIGNKSTLVQVMAWKQKDKLFPEPMVTQFTNGLQSNGSLYYEN